MNIIRPEELYMSMEDGNLEYFIDDNGIYWYDYDKLIKLLHVTSNQADKLYNYLEDHNKNIFNILSRFKSEDQQKRFVTTEAVCEIINKQSERGNGILLKILNNESRKDVDYSDFNREFNQMIKMKEQGNIVYTCQSIKRLTEMDVYKDTMDKYDPDYDKEKEELIDLIREDVYEFGDMDDCEFKLNKIENDREIVYKKLNTSSLPVWYRNVIK